MTLFIGYYFAKYVMERKFVKALLDIHCNWHNEPPVYRVYVNEELFSERTYIWKDSYLTEVLQIEADPGQYSIRVESVPAGSAEFLVKNHRIGYGPGRWIDPTTVEIAHES